MKKARILTLVIILFAFSAARAEFWSNSNGSGSHFDWQNGRSDSGLFGEPVLEGGDTLVFYPSTFRAESTDGNTISVSDRLDFDLIVNSGFNLDNIIIAEHGGYGIRGTGQVSAISILTAKNLDTREVITGSLTMTPQMPISSGSGQWQGQYDISCMGWTRLHITLTNELTATTDQYSFAFIQKETFSGEAITIQIIPEPATVAMLSLGAIFIRYKHHKK